MPKTDNGARPSSSLQKMASATLQAVLEFSPDALLCVTQAGTIL